MYHLPSLSREGGGGETAHARSLPVFLGTPRRRRGRRPDRRKALLIQLLYSADFVPALAFLDWFFPGLYIQALSSVYGSAMLAAGLGRTARWVEAARSGTFVVLTAAALFVADDPSLIGSAFLVTRVLGLWLAARTTGRSYGTRPEEPIGGRLRRLVPAVAVAAVAAAAWVSQASTGPSQRSPGTRTWSSPPQRVHKSGQRSRALCLGAAWRTETPAPRADEHRRDQSPACGLPKHQAT
jgi:hypothetical protein